MPRPSKTVVKGNAGSGSKGSKGGGSILQNNPVSAWFRNKSNIRKQKMEEIAKQISNNKAENEMRIAGILNSINFTESRLPIEKLDYKSVETQPYGDLEYAVVEAVDMISNNTYDYSGVDLSNIDAAILLIATELKNAIETGDVNRSFAAKAGLITAIDQIRNKIPFISENMKRDFVESSEDYLELWKTLIISCTSLDAIQKNLDAQKSSIEQKQKKSNEKNDELARKILEDPEFKGKVEKVMSDTFIGNSNEWDQESMDLYKFLVSQRIEKSSIGFEMLQYDMLVKQCAYQSKIINDYQTRVRQIPIPEDPNLLNKYKDMIEEEYKRASEIDAQFDELGEFMDSMDERLKQMATSKGSVRQRKMVAESVDNIVERAKKLQMKEAGINDDGNQMNALRKIKLLSDTEIQKIKEEQPEPEVHIHIETNRNRPRNTN